MEKYFIIDYKKLQKGDVICTTRKKSILSKSIRIVTKSDYSHVLMVYGYSSFIHADNMGVYSYNFQRLLFNQDDRVLVLRLKEQYKDKIDEICENLKSEVGKVYGTISALNSWLKKSLLTRIEDPDTIQFCSKLIAECFNRVGLTITDNPRTCFPVDIASSDLFEKVEGCLRECLPEEIEFAKTESPQEKQAKTFTNILIDIKKDINVNILTLTEAEDYLIKEPKFDVKMKEVYLKHNFEEFERIELERNSYRYGSFLDFYKYLSQINEKDKVSLLVDLYNISNNGKSSREGMAARFRLLQEKFISINNKESVFYRYMIDFFERLRNQQLILYNHVLKYNYLKGNILKEASTIAASPR